MHRSLWIHPLSLPSPAGQIRVNAVRGTDGRLSLAYIVNQVGAVLIPEQRPPLAADDLWRHTCFEAFVRCGEANAYVELNFSPSTEWAAYGFDGYRSGMRRLKIEAPTITPMRVGDYFALRAEVDLGHLPELVPWETWEIGLSAVIEANDGALSHWALVHPAGPPDFHHRDCFAADLAPAASL